MEYLLAALLFSGGWWTGHQNVTVTITDNPLTIAACVDIYPPAGDSFGETTASYISLVGQYRQCKAACLQQ